MHTFFLRALSVVLLSLPLTLPARGQSVPTATPPDHNFKNIELFYMRPGEGWEEVNPDTEDVPHDAEFLMVTAKTTALAVGTEIIVNAELLKGCFPDGPTKRFLKRFMRFSVTDQKVTVGPGGTIQFVLTAHCDDCPHLSCEASGPGRGDCDRDHLGEGPHIINFTTSLGSDRTAATAMHPYQIAFSSKCGETIRRSVNSLRRHRASRRRY